MRPIAASCRGLCLLVLLAGFLALPMPARGAEPIKFADTQYEPVGWADLDGWAGDDHAAAFATFLTSCRTLEAK